MNPRVSVQVLPASDWNPSLYMKFEDERMLAARDLLARVPLASARLVYDLGCGPGNSAELLSRRFPDADIIGLDTSEAMLNHARTRAPRARFVKQNIVDWVPTEPPNLIFANAALEFLSDHHALFPRLAGTLAPGGIFAAQMPSTARESSHALMRMVAAEGPWSSRLVPVAKTQPMIAWSGRPIPHPCRGGRPRLSTAHAQVGGGRTTPAEANCLRGIASSERRCAKQNLLPLMG
jgi:trans-aconitate 2-methyltransferase